MKEFLRGEVKHLTGKQLWIGFWQVLMWVLLAAGTVAAFARRMGYL